MAKFIPVEPEKWAEMVKAQAEVARLKAEVERLTADLNKMTAWGRGLEADKRLLQHWNTSDEVARLKAEVERLTKAGDAMMGWIDHQHDDSGYQHSEAWEAAKKGGQP